MKFSVENIAQLINAKNYNIDYNNVFVDKIITDTRSINRTENSLFIAIIGKNHNAHHYIKKAIERGVKNFIVSEEIAISGINYWLVDDTIVALQKLAIKHRSKFNLPVVGITGSNGKTVVKEWLNYLLKHDFNIVRSPKSYNSQIGVPLSILRINEKHNLGLFEAGISEVGEMQRLTEIIKPSIGVFTHLGAAHNSGFNSTEQKIKEKVKLFLGCDSIIVNKKLSERFSVLSGLPQLLLKPQKECFELIELNKLKTNAQLKFVLNDSSNSVVIPFTDSASIENTITCLRTIAIIKPDFKNWKLFESLPIISMRLELKEGINNTKIINDTYNCDVDSLKIALDFLNQQSGNKKTLVLSEMANLSEAVSLIKSQDLTQLLTIGKLWKPHNKELKNVIPNYKNYSTLSDLINSAKLLNINNESVLIKGERSFGLDRLSNILSKKNHETVLEINLDVIRHNISYFKEQLSAETKLLVMVKSFAYGAGIVELAQFLEFQKVDYLGVAYVDEGIAIRAAGIKLPIMVMNCYANQIESCIEYDLEPTVFDILELRKWVNRKEFTNEFAIHVKVNTGMNRLGLEISELDELLSVITSHKPFVKSVFSHLSASGNVANDKFTLKQLSEFNDFIKLINLGIEKPFFSHILNSDGLLNYPTHQFDMVRLGLGVYGYSENENLRNCLTLKSFIAQIRLVKKGEYVGYELSEKLNSDNYIATVSIGYGDGLMRKAGNKRFQVMIKGSLYPIIGNICMDMCMISLGNNEHEITTNDEVVIFDEHYSINHLAEACETIPYEIMTNISQRVKRVYYQENA